MHFPNRSDMATHSFTCKQALTAFNPQPQSIEALWLVLILPSHGGQKAELKVKGKGRILI